METALPKENRTMAITDALFRVTYRIVYPIWRLYLRVIGSRTQGAQVAVWYDSEVLVVRNSYRDTYTFPGGYRRSGESTAITAARELCEETGIRLPAADLDFSFAWTYTCGRLECHDDIYKCCLENPPRLAIDNREVVEARFLAASTALQLPLEDHVRDYLEKTAPGSITRYHVTHCY
jgi:8-oxo-dGTP pyrophosphatase MutT (NUDIX family)